MTITDLQETARLAPATKASNRSIRTLALVGVTSVAVVLTLAFTTLPSFGQIGDTTPADVQPKAIAVAETPVDAPVPADEAPVAPADDTVTEAIVETEVPASSAASAQPAATDVAATSEPGIAQVDEAVSAVPRPAYVNPVVRGSARPLADGDDSDNLDSALDVVECTDAQGRTVRMGAKQAEGTACGTSLDNTTVTEPMSKFTCPTEEQRRESPMLAAVADAEGCPAS